MQKILAIDPGVKISGWALFEEAELIEIGRTSTKATDRILAAVEQNEQLPVADNLIIEKPVVYPFERQKGDQNDLIDLAIVVGYFSSFYEFVRLVTPRQWKGRTPKDISNRRILEACPEAEKMLESIPQGQQNHAIDAIGIGIWYLKN